jgi:hypothetical protein
VASPTGEVNRGAAARRFLLQRSARTLCLAAPEIAEAMINRRVEVSGANQGGGAAKYPGPTNPHVAGSGARGYISDRRGSNHDGRWSYRNADANSDRDTRRRQKGASRQ